MILGALFVAVFTWLFIRRARAKSRLAGLDATRPVFSVEPPTRRLTSRKHEAL